ncbi:MAG: GrpB family protein [Bacteroidota bacterium]
MPLTSPIVPYSDDWPKRFREEKAQLSQFIRPYFREIYHVGSTAVPGLTAKPEIDLLIIIPSLAHIEAINEGMHQLGYQVRGECGLVGRHYFSKDVDGQRTHKAHVCESNNIHGQRLLIFRDYLRDHPAVSQAYGELKLKLEAHNRDGIAEYLEGKTDFILEVLTKAVAAGYGQTTKS